MSPAAKERLEREFNKKKDALHGREVALHARDVDFKKRATALSDEARAKTLQDLQTEAMQLQKEMAEAQTALEKMQQELTQPILDRMHTALAKIAQRDGYAMIFDQREQNVVYADSALDLTPKLLAELTP